MSYKSDLEKQIRESYNLIRDYEEIVHLTNDPKEKSRAKREIEEQWGFIKSYLDDYTRVCNRLHQNFADDIAELLIHFPQNGDDKGINVKAPIIGPINIFFSYAREDEELCIKLLKQLSLLKQQGLIKEWHNNQISPGKDRAYETNMHLNSADIILLLVSADFIASDYCYSTEMRQALERHQTGEAKVVPIILRPVDWKDAPFGKLQALPRNNKPVTSWKRIDEAFLDIALEIRKIIEELKSSSVINWESRL